MFRSTPYAAVPADQPPMPYEAALRRARAVVNRDELISSRVTTALLLELAIRAERLAEAAIERATIERELRQVRAHLRSAQASLDEHAAAALELTRQRHLAELPTP